MRNYFILLIIFLTTILSSCKNELDINADPKETAVVYGIIDPNADYQYIRINKTYLVESNAIEAAQNGSLMNFGSDLKVTLKRIEVENNKETEKEAYAFVLDSSITKESGMFYKSPNVVFKALTTSPKLTITENSLFYIEIENTKTGYKATSKTVPVFKTNIGIPLSFYYFKTNPSAYTLSLFNQSSNTYSNVGLVFTIGKNAKIIFPFVRFFYHEGTGNSKSAAKSIDFKMPIERADNSNGDVKFQLNINTEAFYQYLGEKIEVKENVKRFADSIQVIVETGNGDFDTFYTVSNTSSNTTLEKPTYTNINNGLGIFAAKYTTISTHKNYYDFEGKDYREFYIDNKTTSISAAGMTYYSLKELATGKYTKNLNFAYFETTQNMPIDTLFH